MLSTLDFVTDDVMDPQEPQDPHHPAPQPPFARTFRG
jgi:hypothetical protein